VTRERDGDTGQYREEYTDDEIEQLLRGTRLSTTEVAEELGCHRTTAHSRLTELEDKGLVTSTRVGSAKVWTTTDSP